MDARPRRRGLTNGLGGGRTVPPPPGHVNGIRGATNGLVNGTGGRANGLVNGTRGRTNGLVNGTRGRTNGLVNGTGAVNGSGFVNGLSLRRNPFGIVTHRDLRRSGALLALSVAAMLVFGYLLGVPDKAGSAFAADGAFDEWDAVPKHDDDTDAVGAGDLRATAVREEAGRVFFYAWMRDALFAGSEPSSVYLLVSVDGRDGYRAAEGFEAAFVAEAYGWDDALQGTVLREWTGGAADADNASALVSRGAFPAAAAGQEIEIALDVLDLDLDSSAGTWFRFATRAGGDADLGPIMGPAPGGLRIEQDSLATTIGASTAALRLNVTALAVDVTVQGLTLQVTTGGGYTPPGLPFTVPARTTHVVDITVTPGSLAAGSVLTAGVATVDAVVDGGGPVVRATIVGNGARAYVGARTAGHAVDGLFLDWSGQTEDEDAGIPDTVDIRASAVALESGAFFYVRTDGVAMGGALLPVRHSRPVPGNGSAPPPTPAPLRRVAGEDVLRIYVDSDDRDPAGVPFAGVVADRLVDVRGRLGRITAADLYAWDGPAGRWVPRTETVDLALVGSELEASVPPAFLGTTSNASAAFAMSDWSGAGDEAGIHDLRGTRGGPRLRPWHGSSALTAVVTPLADDPTIDGDCDTGGTGTEYAGANSYNNADLTFLIGRRSGTQFVFVCLVVSSDGTSNGFDWGELLFDTAHGGGTAPQDDDRRFRVNSGSSVLVREKGDGSTWIPCGSSCDGGDSARGAFTDGAETYEFTIRFSDVWGTNTPDANQEAGFALGAYDADANAFFWWGSDDVDETSPGTWGHIDIPEFPPVAAAVGVLALGLLRRRRGLRAANP